jgi:NAD(P)-dependent dehydrogenase (short-subunit alcohol dehydrogenase family)
MRAVVVTGASRGLGRATVEHLYRNGWTVVAAMRAPERDMPALREALGAADIDPRLLSVRLDVEDAESVAAAAKEILERVGAPHGVVHNAGVTSVGTVEEMPVTEFERIVSTNYLGPVRLTAELLPAMREARRGRIVMVSSESAVLGMPGVGAYGASKSALETWAEALSSEIAPFGLGVTVLVTGTFKTDILEQTHNYGDRYGDGPYAPMHDALERRGRAFTKLAADPSRFAPAVARALDDAGAFRRRGVGIDAKLLLLGRRTLPTRVLQRIIAVALGLPR